MVTILLANTTHRHDIDNIWSQVTSWISWVNWVVSLIDWRSLIVSLIDWRSLIVSLINLVSLIGINWVYRWLFFRNISHG